MRGGQLAAMEDRIMSPIERVASNTPWEPIFGYVRMVRAGDWLAISGTTATDERGLIVGGGQMYVQARQAMSNLKHHIESAGFTLAEVIRTRVFVTDISRFADVARAHKEIFGENPPASTLVEVRGLVHPDMLIEVEADAFRGASAAVEAPTSSVKPTSPAKPTSRTPSRASAKAKSAKPKSRK
jgi:enamine deaminase RidA (YjgF/YER057c/UK114 family)